MRRKDRLRPARAGWLVAVAALAGCQPAGDGEVNQANETEPTVNLPSVSMPSPAIDRAGLLTAIAQAASATAAGADDSAAQRNLDGRQFEFRIRFGCRGPAPDLKEAMFGWSRDSETGTLRLRATPTISRDSDIVADLATDAIEEVEGFWIPRPWLLSSSCPAAAAANASSADTSDGEASLTATDDKQASRPPKQEPKQQPKPAPKNAPASAAETAAVDAQEMLTPPPVYPRVGIAQFFTRLDPRTQRRSNRPYEAVKSIPPEELVGAEGFNLVLSGRLKAIPGKGVIHCVSRGSDAPPDCVVSADIDKVWIEQPGARTPLAEWGGG